MNCFGRRAVRGRDNLDSRVGSHFAVVLLNFVFVKGSGSFVLKALCFLFKPRHLLFALRRYLNFISLIAHSTFIISLNVLNFAHFSPLITLIFIGCFFQRPFFFLLVLCFLFEFNFHASQEAIARLSKLYLKFAFWFSLCLRLSTCLLFFLTVILMFNYFVKRWSICWRLWIVKAALCSLVESWFPWYAINDLFGAYFSQKVALFGLERPHWQSSLCKFCLPIPWFVFKANLVLKFERKTLFGFL